ncbi:MULTISPECIES: NAD(+) kinase [Alteromonadaceae]|jgi:NAD+ kinase|uniref:NAD kinase n=1 Tax=Brumicola blandensis TaxID=3075611 RepID=A0AAW8R0G3_9ALTE|nr:MULTISPECIES: NAD(+) kinase [unclassified Alteromonas]MDT0581894.1 NAD(+) kinase [Alteromonas sp. W409]MDT0628429.1 NAD(+) kinase [Alteromonas sp. W364]
MSYTTVGLIGKTDHEGSRVSLNALVTELKERNCTILVEARIKEELDDRSLEVCALETLGERAELAIVVGGDGYMLGAARILAQFDTDVVGVNRGNLGFLTDINPEDITRQIANIFEGKVHREERFLLEANVFREDKHQETNAAVNEIVLHHEKVAHMMEFELYVDNQFVFSQRSDGIICATPTGSTAYSLSGGGPILMPQLDALTLVPMFPHTLSSRPIVVDAKSEITLKVSNVNTDNLQVSCDSHIVISLKPGDEVRIRKNPNKLNLVHPLDYNYFNVLRTKLNWGSKLY